MVLIPFLGSDLRAQRTSVFRCTIFGFRRFKSARRPTNDEVHVFDTCCRDDRPRLAVGRIDAFKGVLCIDERTVNQVLKSKIHSDTYTRALWSKCHKALAVSLVSKIDEWKIEVTG